MKITVEPRIKIIRVAIIVLLGLLISFAAIAAYHPARVYLAHGEWCVRFTPEGHKQVFYSGRACGF